MVTMMASVRRWVMVVMDLLASAGHQCAYLRHQPCMQQWQRRIVKVCQAHAASGPVHVATAGAKPVQANYGI
jgi:hypothetical protein